MHAVIVAGSSLTGELDAYLFDDADLVVAVDSGAEALSRVGLVPDILIGDMDSISPVTRETLEVRGVEVVLLETAKDETDTEAALRLVVDRGADAVTVYGALGGPRLDHLVGNLLLLSSPWLTGVGVRMVDELHDAFLVVGDVVFGGRQGDMVSLLPLTPEVGNVRTMGLRYPLNGETLFQSATRGVSNAMAGPEARVTHGAGVLLLIHYRGR
ncbi:MAG: thiamine diphosphokinase [Thermoleophilia bacterium]|nr:thiamine diphosphokinase [Thermoleophilia bacterium]